MLQLNVPSQQIAVPASQEDIVEPEGGQSTSSLYYGEDRTAEKVRVTVPVHLQQSSLYLNRIANTRSPLPRAGRWRVAP